MFCKSHNYARASLARVSVRLGLIFFSENESYESASKTKSLGSASKARHHLHHYYINTYVPTYLPLYLHTHLPTYLPTYKLFDIFE